MFSQKNYTTIIRTYWATKYKSSKSWVTCHCLSDACSHQLLSCSEKESGKRNIASKQQNEKSNMETQNPFSTPKPSACTDINKLCLQAFNRSFPVFLFFCFFFPYLKMRRNALKYRKNIRFSYFSERPMQTLWRNSASRHRGFIYVY